MMDIVKAQKTKGFWEVDPMLIDILKILKNGAESFLHTMPEEIKNLKDKSSDE